MRWTGSITVPTTGEYTFYAIGDNGIHLSVDGDQLIDFSETGTSSRPRRPSPSMREPPTTSGSTTSRPQVARTCSCAGQGPASTAASSRSPLPAFSPPADFDVYPANASVGVDVDTVTVNLDGDIGGATSALENLRLTGDQTTVLIATATSTGTAMALNLAAPVYGSTSVRLAYYGAESLTVDGAAVPAFDIPVENTSTYQMTTEWAADVDPDNPLPEYPRPQLVRDAGENLNGTWEFEAATATSAKPFGTELEERVVVPYPIESLLSGINRHEDHMVYRRAFEVPVGWNVVPDNRLQLNFGAVDHDATVFVNVTEVVRHRGGFDPFSADITDELMTGGDEIVVRVTVTTTNTARGKQVTNLSGIFYPAASGIRQAVWMEPVVAAHIDRLKITPDLDSSSLTVNVVSATPPVPRRPPWSPPTRRVSQKLRREIYPSRSRNIVLARRHHPTPQKGN